MAQGDVFQVILHMFVSHRDINEVEVTSLRWKSRKKSVRVAKFRFRTTVVMYGIKTSHID